VIRHLNVEEATVRYGTNTAVSRVSFTVEPGQVLGLVGESGSGKSSIARAIIGLAPLAEGSARLGDITVAAPKRRGRRVTKSIQMIFQNPRTSFNPRMTIGQSIREVMTTGKSAVSPAERCVELMERMSLDPDVLDQRPNVLSGGMLQRAAIARALSADPEILIADEVTSSLDVSVQAVVLNHLRAVQAETGLSILFVSHNLAVVRYVSDYIAVMRRGEVVESGPTLDLVANPQHPYTKQLLEAVPVLLDSPQDRAKSSVDAPQEVPHGD
jgi:peptide/nickel transport system ATP-binding protein